MDGSDYAVEDVNDVKVAIDATLDIEEVGEKRVSPEDEQRRAKKKMKFKKLKQKRQEHGKVIRDKRLDLRSLTETSEQSEIFWDLCKDKFEEKLSPLEEEIHHFKEEDFVSIASPSRQDAHLAKAILDSVPSLKSSKSKSDSPSVVIACLSARRAMEICNHLRSLGNYRIAKLFAKHLKIADQVDVLSYRPPIAIGTPNRILKLCELGHLDVASASVFVIDLGLDTKKFSILSLPQVNDDLFKLIDKYVRQGLSSQKKEEEKTKGGVKFMLF